jgi:hypothetical protein
MPDTTPPALTGTVPSDDAVNVAPAAVFYFLFDEGVTPSFGEIITRMPSDNSLNGGSLSAAIHSQRR